MIKIDYRDARPIYEQVVDGIEGLALRGALPADTQLPSVRQLAMELSINPNTIQRAYGELERRGVIDLLPALVTAAALLGGPAEAAVVGLTVGICYDLSFTGVDGLYPLFFLLFGYAAGKLCQRLLTRNYISMLILTAFECVLLGLLRYLFSLMHAGASFLIVLRQLAVGTVLTCLFCFIVYLPLRRLSGKSRKRSR